MYILCKYCSSVMGFAKEKQILCKNRLRGGKFRIKMDCIDQSSVWFSGYTLHIEKIVGTESFRKPQIFTFNKKFPWMELPFRVKIT